MPDFKYLISKDNVENTIIMLKLLALETLFWKLGLIKSGNCSEKNKLLNPHYSKEEIKNSNDRRFLTDLTIF